MDEQSQKVINGLVPLAIALGTFLIISLGIDIFTEIMITPEKFDSPIFVIVSLAFIILVYSYCLFYGKNNLGYFAKSNRLTRDLLLLVILPGMIAVYSGVQTYRAKNLAAQQVQKS